MKGIGASDAPVIMGENPWKTPQVLLDEKLGKIAPFQGNAATRRGNELEPIARSEYAKTFNLSVAPAVIQCISRDWQIASLDGISSDRRRVVEIKCGVKVYEYAARHRKPPQYYFGQLQHTLSITGLEKIDFYCFLPNKSPVFIEVPRDDKYIRKMIEEELRFFEKMQPLSGKKRATKGSSVANIGEVPLPSRTQNLRSDRTFEERKKKIFRKKIRTAWKKVALGVVAWATFSGMLMGWKGFFVNLFVGSQIVLLYWWFFFRGR